MKRFLLIPFLAISLLQSGGTAAPSPRKSSRARKKLPYKAKVPGVDPTMGDNVDGDDLVIRRAAVAALGTFAGSVVVVDPSTGRILTMVNQKLALKTGFVPCSTIKLVTALAALTEGLVSKNTTVFTSRFTSYNLTQALARSNNQYFNILGTRLGFDRVHHYAEMLGLGEKAGLDIPGEQPGYLPLETPEHGGVGMMTSYGDLWQGNPVFDPVLQELHRRKAVVFCHPLPAQCCTALMPRVAPREALFLEFPYDTGRAVVSLLMSGSFVKYRDIRWIFCHCGGPVPALAGRIRNAMSEMSPEVVARMAPNGLDYELRRQYYDTADAAYGPTMAAIMNYIPKSQILFGTDYPFLRVQTNAREITDRGLSAEDMRALQRGNVTALMPQLAN